ncbi:hypothetical protein L596_022219 [Steinernema carpocapsae]|uniref:Uncharacterized protein n=1 Tax=Steinernema carpocapsae TaxID=34508 RepID=A0A4U5ML65_STECR|nr:hypothetical protein L596_022219 [Steinernema carpocapsae]
MKDALVCFYCKKEIPIEETYECDHVACKENGILCSKCIETEHKWHSVHKFSYATREHRVQLVERLEVDPSDDVEKEVKEAFERMLKDGQTCLQAVLANFKKADEVRNSINVNGVPATEKELDIKYRKVKDLQVNAKKGMIEILEVVANMDYLKKRLTQ